MSTHGAVVNDPNTNAAIEPHKELPLDKQYAALVSMAELLDARLVSTHAKLHAERLAAAGDDLFILLPNAQWKLSREQHLLHCGSRLQVHVVPKDPAVEASEPILEVVAEYMISYRAPPDLILADSVAQQFAARNGVFNAWPFFRELAHSLVMRMGMPPLLIPLMRMPPMPPTR